MGLPPRQLAEEHGSPRFISLYEELRPIGFTGRAHAPGRRPARGGLGQVGGGGCARESGVGRDLVARQGAGSGVVRSGSRASSGRGAAPSFCGALFAERVYTEGVRCERGAGNALDSTRSDEAVGEARAAPLTGWEPVSPAAMAGEFGQRNQELAALVARLAARDQDALTPLYDRTNRQLYSLLLRILGNAATAEEVLFDVYAQAWQQSVRYDPTRGTPLAWLITMARSRALDRLRSGGLHERGAAPLNQAHALAGAADAEADAMAAELRRLVQSALAALPREQRTVIELAYYSGLSHSEIAAELGQPLGTVKTRTRRAMIKLRDILNPVMEGVF